MPTFTRRSLLALAISSTVAGCARDRASEVWQRHDPSSAAQVDHRVWQAVLDRATRDWPDGVTRVDYAGMADRERDLLDVYVAEQASIDVSILTRREQLAYWINLYNALTVRLILQHPSVASADEIAGAGGATVVTIAGETVSLVDIRRAILAPVFRDPRWVYALCDGTLGAPSLARRAYTGTMIDRRLETAAIDYVGQPRAVDLPPARPDTVRLNAVWRRHRDDFGGTDQAILAAIDLYADGVLRAELKHRSRIEWMDDRRLNGLPASPLSRTTT